MKAQRKLILAGAALMLAACVYIPPEVAAEFEPASDRKENRFLPPSLPAQARLGETAVR